jgi:hypothetical protein
MENEQREQEPQQTQAITKINSINFNDEKFGSNDSLARNYTGNKLRDMYHLKQLEDILTLYDKVRPDDLRSHLTKYYTTRDKIRTFSVLKNYAIVFGVFLYLGIKRQNPFVFQSYINQIYTVPLLAFAIHHAYYMSINSIYAEEENMILTSILRTKSLVHSCSVKITNRLKYDITDLV